MKVLGSGRQGVVYNAGPVALKVSPRDLSAVKRGENQPALVEYKIHAAVQKVARGGVPKVLSFSTQKDFVSDLKKNIKEKKNKNKNFHEQSILTMEKIKGISIRDWIEKGHGALTDAQVMRAIRQVLATLKAITKKYPNFRHNDLHLDNVMIVGGRAKILDFGWARLSRAGGNNPAVNTAVENGTAGVYGIGPRTDARYDSHLFLKEMRTLLSRYPKFKRTAAHLDTWVPIGYRGFNDRYTREGRLKYGLRSYPGLPKLHNLNAARPTARSRVSKREPTGLKTLM
jgi:serine/threonine protein kinase